MTTLRTKVEKDAEINVAEKQPKRNEPGLTVQSLPFDVEMEDIEDIHENLIPDHLKNAATQTDLSCNSILPPEPLHKNMRSSDFDEAFFSGDDDKVKFHTGLPSFEILQKVFSFVESHVDRRRTVVSKFQECCMVLVKLRLAVPHLDLAYRLKISTSSVSRILIAWLTVMDIRFTPLIKWPSRDA